MLNESENNIIEEQKKFAMLHSYKMMKGQPNKLRQREKIIIKQIPFNKNNYFDRIFYHLGKIQNVNPGEGFLKQKGFCVTQVNDMAFELWIVYPKLEYNLYAVIKRNILDSDSKKMSFALQLAQSLKNIHTNNSYHGNIKPNNILMDSAMKAYFSDWEFSSKMNNKERISKQQKKKDQSESTNIQDDDSIDKNPLYCDGYAAPEIFQNPQSGQFTGSSADIWGLGMIYYYIFTGRDPSFCGLVEGEQIYNKIDLKMPREHIQNEEICELIEGMVKFNANQRSSIEQVRDILQQLSSKELKQIALN